MTGGLDARRTALLYLLAGTLWIAVSDRLLARLVEPDHLVLSGMIKGCLYVLTTAFLVHWLVRRSSRGLEKERAWYSALFELGPDPLFILSEDNDLIEVNEVASERYGYSRAELARMRLDDITTTGLRPGLGERLREAANEATTLASRHVTREGLELDVELTARRLRHGVHRYLLCAARDVTGARAAEAALRESEARLRRAVEDAPFPAMIHAEDGEVLTVNRTWKELTGYDEDLLTIDAWVDRTNPEDPVGVRDEIASLFEATARVVEGVFPVACRDGSKRLWEFSSSPLGTLPDGRRLVISMAADLTERMEASAARELLMTAIEQLGEAVIITDADGAIEYVNRAFERTTGYSRGEAAGRNPRMLRSGEHDDAFYAELWGTLAQGRTWKGRMRNRRKDGTLFTEETTISPVRDDGGAIRHYVAVKNDITARLELEDRLRQRSKMESIGRLAGGVAHDFNNMLTVILGHTELALDSVAPAAPIHDNLVEIRQAAERSGEMTRQLLAFARHQASQPARVSPNDRIEGMVRLLRRLIGEGIELVWKPQPALGQVEVDPGQFDQVLTNLCVNARDAIDGTGTVTIETRKVALDDLHCRSRAGLEPGEYFLLTVSDDGRGMDSTTLERAFEPYFTTKGIGKGTGLGLATVYGIAEQNRGFVEADSAPGSGATFRLYLPLVAAPELPVLPEEPRSAEAAAGGTILLVEDEPLILELGTEMLHRLGYTVLPAGGPDDALRLAADHRGTIDLLITDVVMPSMTGPELAERLQTLRPEMPCLYISGFTADAMAARGGMEDDIHFLQKPFLLQDLAAKVRTAVGSPPGRVVPA